LETPKLSIVMFAIAALLGAAGQFLYRSGAERAEGGVWGYVVNPWILGGVVCYVAVMVLFVAAFRRGGAMMVLYPIYASTFIWAALIALAAYGEAIRPVNVLGWILMVVAMYLMGR